MSYSADYIIGTLSSSVKQQTTEDPNVQAPYRFGGGLGALNLRNTCLPYAPTQNSDSSFVFEKIDCFAPPKDSGGDGGIIYDGLGAQNMYLVKGDTDGLDISGLALDASIYSDGLGVYCLKENAFGGSNVNGAANHVDMGTSIDFKNDSENSPNGWTMAFWVYADGATGNTQALYQKGWQNSVADHDESHMISVATSAGGPYWNMELGGGTFIARQTAGYHGWYLAVFEIFSDEGSLVPKITTVWTPDDGEPTSDVYTGNSSDIGSDTATGEKSYFGALNTEDALISAYGGISSIKVTDIAMWNNTFSLGTITDNLYNEGRPTCLSSGDLATNLQHWWRTGDGTKQQ